MHQLRDGRRGFHASTLSGIPSHTRGRKEGGTERFGCAGALVSVDIESRMIKHLKSENVQFFWRLFLKLEPTTAYKFHQSASFLAGTVMSRNGSSVNDQPRIQLGWLSRSDGSSKFAYGSLISSSNSRHSIKRSICHRSH